MPKWHVARCDVFSLGVTAHVAATCDMWLPRFSNLTNDDDATAADEYTVDGLEFCREEGQQRWLNLSLEMRTLIVRMLKVVTHNAYSDHHCAYNHVCPVWADRSRRSYLCEWDS